MDEEIGRLRAALLNYGNHLPTCDELGYEYDFHLGECYVSKCPCGWAQMRVKLMKEGALCS